MYAALDLGQRTIQAVLKRDDGKIVKEVKAKRDANQILQGTNASVVMESGYSYAKLVPGTRQSGDMQYQRTDVKGSEMLNWIMVQCTHVHVRHCHDSSISRHYEKIKVRKGSKIAIMAAAQKMMCAIYVMLKEDRSFRLDG